MRDEVHAVPQGLDIAVSVTQADIAGWRATRLSNAGMLARLFAEPRGAESLPRYDRFLDAVAESEEYLGIWTFDGRGRLLGAAGPDAERASAPVAPPMSASRDTSEVRTIGAPYGRSLAPALEFHATRAGARVSDGSTVVLRARPGDSTFRNLNPTSTANRTARTSLLVRSGDSVLVVATRSHSGNRVARRAFHRSEVPPYALDALNGLRSQGVGLGLFGQEVAYAAQPTLAPGWALIREMDTAELEKRLRTPLLVQSLVFGALAALLAFALANGIRAASVRRERELTRLRTEFVASASHELRTPLAQIRLFSELLRSGGLSSPTDTDRALGVIANESQRLAALVDDLLEFASMRRNAELREGETCDVTVVTRQVLADFAPLAAERNVSIDAQLESDVVAWIGPEAYRQVLINFLDNAVKYGPPGQTITVRVAKSTRLASLSVEDRGPGVPAAERERVWRAFYRHELATASGEPGSGLGLAVVRDLVLQCGGATRVEDGRDGGARFVAEFPRA